MKVFNLKQNKMSMTEYDHICYGMSVMPHNRWVRMKLSEKFCSGLKYEIRMALANHGEFTYLELVNKALDAEAVTPRDRPTQTQTGKTDQDMRISSPIG